MTNYEVTFIVDPVLSADEIQATAQTYVDLLRNEGCNIVHVDEMGLRQLAYNINKRQSGVYYCVEFETPNGDFLTGMELSLRRDERIMRFLTARLDKYGMKFNADKRNGLIGKKKSNAPERDRGNDRNNGNAQPQERERGNERGNNQGQRREENPDRRNENAKQERQASAPKPAEAPAPEPVEVPLLVIDAEPIPTPTTPTDEATITLRSEEEITGPNPAPAADEAPPSIEEVVLATIENEEGTVESSATSSEG